MAGDEAGGTRRRRRRRAVWRPGEGISRSVEAADCQTAAGGETVDGGETAAGGETVDGGETAAGGETVDELGDIGAAGIAATAGIADVDRPGGTDRVPTEPAAQADPPVAKQTGKRPRIDPAERGLRELVGAGPSQLGPVRAMRARDANRPTEADIAEAEASLTIVRRNWKPPPT